MVSDQRGITQRTHSTKQKVVLIDARSERVPADTESAGVMERTDHLTVQYFEGHGYLS